MDNACAVLQDSFRKDNKNWVLAPTRIEFLYKLYLPVARHTWEWASPAEIAKKVRLWGRQHDVCVYVSPLARVAGEPTVLEIIDLDANKEAPHLACDAAFLLFDAQERELFDPVLSALKGLKFVANFYLPLEFHESFLIWLKRKQKKSKIKELGAEIDFQPP